MVRRHLLPPGKFETFQPINTTVITTNNNQQQNNTNYQQKQSDMARIIPKSLTINQSKELRRFNTYKMHPNFNLEF
jgi:inner membrane protein involved in colicin E2 resistance